MKSSAKFLYNLVFLNQLSNLLEPFAKKIEATIRKGVVGNTGTRTPIIPRPVKINPKAINTILVNFNILPLFSYAYVKNIPFLYIY